MVLYLIGLGLGDAGDISVSGLEVVRRCDEVYLEAYTSILSCGAEELAKFYGRPVLEADRECVEQGLDAVMERAVDREVALLVVGDPLAATTHQELVLTAVRRGLSYRVLHNASIFSAVACCGLQLYSIGETVSIPFWTDTWRPTSFLDKIGSNLSRGLHTLCLLDIKVKEQSDENLARGRRIFEPPRFMSADQAASQLLRSVQERAESNDDNSDICRVQPETLVVALGRVGATSQRIVCCSLLMMASVDLGPPLHSLIVVGKTHPLEDEYLKQFRLQEEETGGREPTVTVTDGGG